MPVRKLEKSIGIGKPGSNLCLLDLQYLPGHENSKATMDIYAKVKYNKPEEVVSVVNAALSQ